MPRSPERRHLLRLLGGSLAATAALRLAVPDDASAANGQNMVAGVANSASAITKVTTTAGSGFSGNGTTAGVAGTATGTATANAGVSGKAQSGSNYGVFANGKAGTTGPLELANTTITNFPGPTLGHAFLYTRANGKLTELRMKLPNGGDILLASG
jgi:hypothetical protein